MIRYFISRLFITFACLVLASCITLQEQTTAEPSGWVAEQKKRQKINVWEIRGRLGLQTEFTGGTLDIIWHQADQEYSIRLIAPLAAGNYLIQGNNQFAEVRFPDGQKKLFNNVDEVFSSTLDVDLPVAAIKDWVRGLPAKAYPVDGIIWNERGLLNKVKQSGWRVEMTKYAGNKILLPHNLYLTRDDDAELDIRLVLRRWLID